MQKISVILPNFNHAVYLPRRIESILSQTVGDFELLILDNKSTDDSREVISRYLDDPRVRAVFNETNSGSPYLQWRLGLSLSQSTYVWFAESDDYAEPTLLERLVGALDDNPNAGMAVSNSMAVDEEDKPLFNYLDQYRVDPHFAVYGFEDWNRDFVMSGRDYCVRYMFPWNTIPNASALVFRRSALEAVGGNVIDMKICGDWMTYVKVLSVSDIVRVADTLNYFRHHKSNVRTKTKIHDYVSESQAVHDVAVREFGLPRTLRNQKNVLHHFAQVIMGRERRPPSNKVPFSKMVPMMLETADLGVGLLAKVSTTLAREFAADVVQRIGVRGKWKQSTSQG